MTTRYRIHTSKEKNRKQRKARWRHVNMLMKKYPDCNYGEFYCDHVYDPEYPWCWVDFRFFHTKLKKYFAVALTTVEYKEWHKDADRALLLAEEKYPFEDSELNWEKKDINEWINAPESDIQLARNELEKSLGLTFNKLPRQACPEILTKDYGPVVVGVWATVNKEYIDEHVIRDFIKLYRSLGEPITPGFKWHGEKTEIIPEKLNCRYPAPVES